MPELEDSETKQTDEASAILAGYLKPKDLAKGSGRFRTHYRGSTICEKVRRASRSAARSITGSIPLTRGSHPVSVPSHAPDVRGERVRAR